MYRLNEKSVEKLHEFLTLWHGLPLGRCDKEPLENLVFGAIKYGGDDAGQLGKHASKADIAVIHEGKEHLLQIKSGGFIDDYSALRLSGYRMSGLQGDIETITAELLSKRAEIIAFPYGELNKWRHWYMMVHVDPEYLTGITADKWEHKPGKSAIGHYRQVNEHGVVFKLYPTMSWQIWWEVPKDKLQTFTKRFDIDVS